MAVRRRSSTDASELLGRVEHHRLPDEAVALVDAYEATIDDRDAFLWRWAHHLFPEFRLSCVAPEYADEVRHAKLAGLMYVSVLDDVAEKHADRATFGEAAKIPFGHRTVNEEREGVDPEVLAFAAEVWDVLASTLDGSPRGDEFADVFRFDCEQVLNAIEYSYLANQHLEFVTRSELQRYETHNMMLFGFAGLDLVHSPAFDATELSTLRRVIQPAQRMVRIGNWTTTWERELFEGDFTSGIVAYALDHDLVSAAELREIRGDADAVQQVVDRLRAENVEAVFFQQWEAELASARQFEGAIESVDVGAYLDGIETVMEYHLASKGLK